jgi:hypothetical protein
MPVQLAGWLHRFRQLSQVSFLILRDGKGLAQVVIEDPEQMAELGAHPSAYTFSFFARIVLDWLPAQWVGAERPGRGRTMARRGTSPSWPRSVATASALAHPGSVPPRTRIRMSNSNSSVGWRSIHVLMQPPVFELGGLDWPDSLARNSVNGDPLASRHSATTRVSGRVLESCSPSSNAVGTDRKQAVLQLQLPPQVAWRRLRDMQEVVALQPAMAHAV